MDENRRSAIVDETKFHDEAVTIEIGSEFSSGRNTPPELISLIGREEASIGNIDSIAAQKRALTICKLEKLESKVAKSKLLLAEGSIEILPDGGKKLRENIREQEKENEKLINELENTTLLTRNFDEEETESTDETGSLEERSYMHDERSNFRNDPNLDLNIPMDPIFPELEEQFLPQSKEQETREKELALIEERLKDLHKSLVACPSEDEEIKDPRGLKVQLMPHQRHALALG